MKYHMLPLIVALLVSAATIAVPASTAAACDRWQAAKKSGRVKQKRIDEASGMVASRVTRGLLWTMNDQAGDARLFGLSPEGKLLAQFDVHVRSKDWESLATGPCADESTPHCLYVGDIGGSSPRRNVQVVRFPEPSVSHANRELTRGKVASVEVATFAYSDGRKRDAEAMFIDESGTLWLFDKDRRKTTLFRAKFSQGLTRGAQLERVAVRRDIEFVTGADLAQDQRHFIVRNHDHAYEFRLQSGRDVAAAFLRPAERIALAKERQGEAVAYAADGRSFFTLSEGKRQPIFQYLRNESCR